MAIDPFVGLGDSLSIHAFHYRAYQSWRNSFGLDKWFVPGSYREQAVDQRHNRPTYNMADALEPASSAVESLMQLQNRANELRLHNRELWDWHMEHPDAVAPGEDYFPDPGASMPRAREIQGITQRLSAFRPEFPVIPSVLEKVAAQGETERLAAYSIPDDLPNIASISGPVSLAEPTSISAPTVISGPTHALSYPYSGPNRRMDTLSVGGLAEGDLDGPFDLADYQMLTQLGIAHTDALFLAQQARLKGAYLDEDLEQWLRIRQNSVNDAEFVLAQWEANGIDATAAFEKMVEIDKSNAVQAEHDFVLYQDRLAEDLDQAFAYGQAITVGSQLQSDPAMLAEPVDLARSSEENANISGCYPLDRPAHALYAAPVWQEDEPPAAQIIREEIEAAGQSPEAEARRQDLSHPERPEDREPEWPTRPGILGGLALDPLSVGISALA